MSKLREYSVVVMLARLASMRCALGGGVSSGGVGVRVGARGAVGGRQHGGLRAAVYRRPNANRAPGCFVVAGNRLASTTPSKSTAPSDETESDPQPEEERRSYRPGIFTRLPSVAAASELKTSARKKATRATPGKGLKDPALREKSLSVKRLQAMTSGYCNPLKTYVKGFPNPDRFHPFERALLELTLSDKKYRTTVEAVDKMRKILYGIGKGYAAQVNNQQRINDMKATTDKGLNEMEAYYSKHGRCVDDLKSIAKMLRRLPVAELETPTVALVGAPNVGKSSLVQALSSGKSEINNYPFTTKGIKMGHFFVETERHIVTDTPGLINRADLDRNKIELLTIATLEHLPTCVVFVTDLSGLSGTSISDQLELRESLFEQFAHRRPWIDVFSKAATVPVLGGTTDPEAQELWNEGDVEEANAAIAAIPDAMPTSAFEGWGIPELQERLTSLLRKHKEQSLESTDFAESSKAESSAEGEVL